MADKLTEDKTPNPLYDFPDSFNDRWSGLPVETPRFNYTPNSSLIESEPRKVEPFKLTPVEGDPFERAAQRLRAPYKHVNDVTDERFPYRSNLPLIANKFIGIAQRGATSPLAAFRGEFPVSDPETGMPTDEAIRRSQDVASLGGPGGMIEREQGAIVGSGPLRRKMKVPEGESGYPTQELFDRVLPALQNKETGKLVTDKRGMTHDDLANKVFDKGEIEPANDARNPVYTGVMNKYNAGFYDPKTKQFFDRDHPDWFNVDSPDLLQAPINAWDYSTLESDTADTGRAVAATRQSFLPNGVPKPEAFDRVLPAVRNLETGKISTTKRGDEHATILDRLWEKQGGDPNVSTMELYNEMLPKNEMGFYDPKNKEFFPRSHPDWQNIDSPDLNPRQAMRSGMVFSDTSKPGMAMASTFYSAVENAVNNVKSNKMPADQWLGTLNNAKGVKPEEMDWLGLKEHLTSKGKEPVTKQEVQDFVNANKVELKEVNKGELKFDKTSPYAIPEVIKAAKQAGDTPGDLQLTLANDGKAYAALMKKFPELKDNEDWAEIVSNKVFGGDSMPTGTTKYSRYQLPGGENYREMLLTLPNQAKLNWKQNGNTLEASNGYKVIKEGENYITVNPEGRRVSANADLDQAKFNLESSHENKYLPDQYRSSHWDESNVLAHVRMNDRTIEGKKSLHIEEIQSDWHQAGRQHSYKDNAKMQALTDEYNSLTKTAKGGALTAEQADARDAARARQLQITDEMNKLHDAVPDAPFKKTWHELALKRMIREAAEKNYDRISWTPGDAQALRYPDEMRKQISSIGWHNKEMGKVSPTGNKQLLISPRNGTEIILVVNNEGIVKSGLAKAEGKHLSEVIGKDMAKDVLGKDEGHINAKDFVMGAEGMKGFYDKMIPNAIEKIGKEHGVKVKTAEIEKPNPTIEPPGFKKTQKVHYIDIPESLKNVAMKKGFPLFSGGFMFSPVAGNPHENK